MVKIVSEFRSLLTAYAGWEVSFNEFDDELSRGLQFVFENSDADGLDFLSEILAGIYEVQDGVMPEKTFRQILQGFLDKNPVPAVPVVVAAD